MGRMQSNAQPQGNCKEFIKHLFINTIQSYIHLKQQPAGPAAVNITQYIILPKTDKEMKRLPILSHVKPDAIKCSSISSCSRKNVTNRGGYQYCGSSIIIIGQRELNLLITFVVIIGNWIVFPYNSLYFQSLKSNNCFTCVKSIIQKKTHVSTRKKIYNLIYKSIY